jgi:hypothetical protein
MKAKDIKPKQHIQEKTIEDVILDNIEGLMKRLDLASQRIDINTKRIEILEKAMKQSIDLQKQIVNTLPKKI